MKISKMETGEESMKMTSYTFLKKKKKKTPEFPEVAFSFSQMCVSSFERHVIFSI